MNGFTYTDIFDTKGIEYLIIIGFLLLIIPVWILINRPLNLGMKVREALGTLTDRILRIPQGLFYSKNHTWTYLEKSGLARVGINDLLQHITGRIELNDLHVPGERINKGDVIARIIQDGKHLDITSPISGEIQKVHTSLEQDSGTINKDPYGEGWIYKIKPHRWLDDTFSCYLAGEATEWLNKELRRFKDFLLEAINRDAPESSAVIMQEGGEMSDNPLSGMSKTIWNDFQKMFLDTID